MGSKDGNVRTAARKADTLWKSEEKYRNLVENIREGIAHIAPEGGVIIYCNEAYAEILALTADELIGRSFFDFLDGVEKGKAHEQWELRLEGIVSAYEVTATAADGTKKILSCGGYPVFGSGGSYEGALQTILDMTGRQEAEEALRRNEERHRLVAKATGEAIWDNDLLTGKQEWAGATEALFGYPPHEGSKGEWWEERIHPEDRGRVLSGLKDLFEDSGEAWTEEYRFRRADGTYATVVDRGYVVRDEKGKAVRMVGSMADVTERRQWEEKLKESEERFKTTFEAAAVGMAHVAPDGRWLRFNDKLCEVFGYSREELLGMTYLELTPAEDREAALDRVRRALEGRFGPYSVERRYVRKDGRRVWVNLSVSLVRKPSGEPDYFACVAEDITERKIAELVPDSLTPREMEILCEVVEGHTNLRISRNLCYSLGTVKLELEHIITKLAVKNRKQAAIRAVEIGLAPPPRY